jgi:hypothetical protein
MLKNRAIEQPYDCAQGGAERMKSNQPSPVWPYLGILVGLFAIAVSAPRGWETLARRESIQTFFDRHPPVSPQQPDAATEASAVEPAQSRVALVSPPSEPVVDESPVVDSARSTTSRVPVFTASLSDGPSDGDDLPLAAPTIDSPPIDAGSLSIDAVAVEAPQASVPSDIDETPAVLPVESSRVPRPETLFAELRRLSSEPQTSAWAITVNGSLEELCAAAGACQADNGPRPIRVVLEELRRLGRQGELLAKTMGDARLEAQLLRAQYALMRRVEIWDAACTLPPAATQAVAQSPADEQAFAALLQRVNQHVREQTHSAAWQEYLLLDRVANLARSRNSDRGPVYITTKPVYETRSANEQVSEIVDQRRQVARELLDRLASGQFSREQRRYVEAAPIKAFQASLRSWAAEPIDPLMLLADLERYEQTDKSTDARRLADDCRYLSWSSDPSTRHLGALVDERYRNANVRLAVTAPFLNRFVPQPVAQVAPFRDVIVGADVTGRSTTVTKLTVLLVPDPQRLRLGLEAHGVVTSNTASTSGPATFYNNGQSQFVVRKLFLCDVRGLNVFPAVAEAESTRSDLISLETDYDGVPLVGSVVRNIARSQLEDRQDEARWQTEHKVATRARTQLDAEISKAVDKMKDRFNTQLWDTLAGLGLDLQPLALSTTEDRAVLRLRLAGAEQLGAYTPRPRAPSDSLMSLQVHESALNNALERLELDGQSFTLPDLFAHLRDKLNRPATDAVEADLPEDVVVTFAPEDAVRVSCHDGRVQVRLAFAELSEGRRRWRNFAVVTHYRPDTSSLDIHFVRDGTIFLEGETLKGKPQVTLRSIFSKVLSAQRGWGLLSPEFATDPRLEDVAISQFTVDEGWIGLAYAPRPTTGPIARKPK